MAQTAAIQGKSLQIRFNSSDASFSVLHKSSGRTFEFGRRGFFSGVTVENPYGEKQHLPLKAGSDPSIDRGEGILVARYRGIGRGSPGMDLRLSFRIDNEDLLLEMDLNEQCSPNLFVDLYYPGPVVLPKKSEAYCMVPVGQGFLMRGNHRGREDGTAGWKPRLSAYHLFDGRVGMTALLETPDDVLLPLQTGRDGVGLWTRWLASHDRFAYPRRLRFCFRDGAGYVEAAGLVREWARTKGFAVTLNEKAKINPNVRKLAGASIVSDYIATMNRRNFEYFVRPFSECEKRFRELVKVSDTDKWVYHLDAWPTYGYDHFHPDVLPVNREAGGTTGLRKLSRTVKRTGSLFLLHDNYNLYFIDALSFTPKDCVWTRDMEPFRNTRHNGGTNSILCPERALKYIRRNYLEGSREGRGRYEPLTDICSPTGTYLDQFFISGGQNEECRNPEHPLTRTQYRHSMLKVMEFMRNDLKMVTSNEHIYDFSVPVTDFAGSSVSLALKSPYRDTVAVPFFSLVFHDCVCFPMDIYGRRGGSPLKQMASLLVLGGMPYVLLQFITDPEKLALAYRLANAAQPVARFHSEVWNLPHSGHRLVNADGSAQESTFGDVSVTVDFPSGEYSIRRGRNREQGRFAVET